MIDKLLKNSLNQGVNDEIRLENLIDLEAMRKILNDFYKIAGLPVAILNLEGDVLLKSHWELLCTQYHRTNTLTLKNCRESDSHFYDELVNRKKKYVIYRCKNGLYEAAAPILIGGQHLGNLYIGQFFLEQPDVAFFTKQAQKYQFPLDEYLKALSHVQIISEKDLENPLNYLCNFAEFLGNIGLKELQRNRAVEELKNALKELDQLRINLEQEKEYLQEEISLTYNFGEILGKNKKLMQELKKVEQVATSDSTVLLLGETGTGKELFARAIHHLSKRKKKPLVKVNCAALPATMIESELYGHEKGAFTGATSLKIGKFELADRGTIFLDEIGDLPLDLQAKLLRVLQENEIERIGGTGPIRIDVRVLAATNRDLDKMRAEGEFRDDLFYRLNIFPIKCPALRERKDDIPMLVKYFLDKFNIKTGKKISAVSQNTYKILNDHNWPGNVRELENVMERAVLLSSSDELDLGNWFIRIIESSANESLQTLDAMQKKYIIHVLKQTGGKIEGQNGASEILGLKPSTLRSRMEKLGVKVGKNIHELS